MAKHLVIIELPRFFIDTIAIARARGYRITLVRSTLLAGYCEPAFLDAAPAYVDRYIQLADSTDTAELLTAMQALHAACPIDGFYCPWEIPLSATASVAASLGVAFTSAEAIERCRAKQVARRTLDEAGIPSARYATAANVAEALEAVATVGFPAIVKPARGIGSKMATVVHDRDELVACVSEHWRLLEQEPPEMRDLLGGKLLIEEKLVGEMMSAEVVADGRTMHVLTLTDRRRSDVNEVLELGSMMPAVLPAALREQVSDYALDVARALGLTCGMSHLEIMLTATGPRLIEANPRAMGGCARTLIRAVFGIDIIETLFDIHVEAIPVSLPGPPRQFCCSHIISGSHPQVLSRDLPDDLTAPFGDSVLEFSFVPRPGGLLPQYRNNYDAVGGFTVRSASSAGVLALRDDILSHIETSTGLDLIR